MKASTTSLALRAIALLLVLASPLVPPSRRDDHRVSVAILVDRSASMGSDGVRSAHVFARSVWGHRRDEALGLLAFSSKAEILARVSTEGNAPYVIPFSNEPGSDLASAIRLARSSLPGSGHRRIVLISDGRATRGDAALEAAEALREGITIDVVPAGAPSFDRPVITELAPRSPRVAEGEPVALDVAVRGKPTSLVRLTLMRGTTQVESRVITLDDQGTAKVAFNDPKPGPGAYVYSAIVRDPASTEDHRAMTAATVGGRPRALVISVDGNCPGVLADAIDKAELDKKLVSISDTIDDGTIASSDLVVLADAPLGHGTDQGAMGLSPHVQESLIELAKNGGGVIVTGGVFGFAPEYAQAPVAKMLPIEIEDQGQAEDPEVSMAIMLDRSGSMGAMVGTHTKIQLAVEAALAASSTLRPQDKLAIGSVDTKTHWNQPLGPIAELEKHRSAIRAIDSGGGGIYVYTALTDAYAVLAGATSPVRHVILFSDTADSEEQCAEGAWRCDDASDKSALKLAETARRSMITTSVVGIGREEDSDTAFLRKLAKAGGGRFYLTSQATDLRRIFVSETRVAARSNLREGPIKVLADADHAILRGVDVAAFPALGGFVDARKRSTADTAIATEGDNKPILASWRYGLGHVVALTTDLRADWKHGWSRWPAAGQVLRQAVRFAIRRRSAGSADLRVAIGDRSATLVVDVPEVPGHKAVLPQVVELTVIGHDGSSRQVSAPLERVGPGRWEAVARTNGEPFAMARVRDAEGALMGEALGGRDTADELRALGPDERALRAIATAGGGRYDPAADDVLRMGGPAPGEPSPRWPLALLLAALIVTVDLWIRRAGRPAVSALSTRAGGVGA